MANFFEVWGLDPEDYPFLSEFSTFTYRDCCRKPYYRGAEYTSIFIDPLYTSTPTEDFTKLASELQKLSGFFDKIEFDAEEDNRWCFTFVKTLSKEEQDQRLLTEEIRKAKENSVKKEMRKQKYLELKAEFET